jgi:hypothetical protein
MGGERKKNVGRERGTIENERRKRDGDKKNDKIYG